MPLFARLLVICGALIVANSAMAEEAARPNLLFAIADDVSYGHMSAYGCRWIETPGFDRVAKEGLLFTRAYTPNAKCAPSRSCLLTGRNSWQLEEAANHWCEFPTKFRVYTEALADAGYFVGSTGKGWGPGVARDRRGRPRTLAGRPFQNRKVPPPTNAMSNNDYAGNFEDFLAAKPEGVPFCFWYGGHEAHRGYEFRSGLEKTDKRLKDIDRVPAYWPDNEIVRTDMLDYALEVEHFDSHLVKMLETLEQRGELENTLVIVTADHGAPFPRVKGQSYDASNRVPLAMMWKAGITAPGRIIDDYVSFIDLAPTYIELAGLTWDESGMAPSPGRSLTDIFRSERSGLVTAERDHVLIGKERHDVGRPNDVGYPIRGIVKNDMLYLRNFEPDRWPAGNPETGYLNTDGSPTKTVLLDGRGNEEQHRYWQLAFGKRPAEELYDLTQDPDCVKNLADDPAYSARREELKEQLFSQLTEEGDPRLAGHGEIFDRYPYADEKNRGFYERFLRGEEIRAGWVNESDFRPID
jgi:N-sulfoglucosamine sulfohydrolase